MSAHTTGPWTLTTVRTSSGICHKVGPFPWKRDRQSHACIYVDYPNHDNRGSFEDELTANARLMAASPDLLALAYQYASECGECWGEGVVNGAACGQCLDIRAVIAKATAP